MKDETTKPPIGVKPCWLVVEERVRELSNAILRELETENTLDKVHTIRQYAIEIQDFISLLYNRCEDLD